MNKTLFEFDEREKMVDIQYYDHLLKELKHSQEYKIQKFLDHDCVVFVGNNTFEVRPIEGYNTRTYTVNMGGNEPTCNCQYCVMERKKGRSGICSHIGAVLMYLKERENE